MNRVNSAISRKDRGTALTAQQANEKWVIQLKSIKDWCKLSWLAAALLDFASYIHCSKASLTRKLRNYSSYRITPFTL